MGRKLIDRTGEQNHNSQGCLMTITACRGRHKVDIEFDNGHIVNNKTYNNFKNGGIKNVYYPHVCGIGFEGEGKYSSKTHPKIYHIWNKMVARCSDVLYYHIKQPTYKDCVVSEKWINFQNYAQWYEENYVEGFESDKDILIRGNKVYSPETCTFVPKEINTCFAKSGSKRGKYLIGVTFNISKGKFEANCGRGKNKTRYLGTFNTEEEAFYAYKQAKEAYIRELADKYSGQITEACYNALYAYQVEITD